MFFYIPITHPNHIPSIVFRYILVFLVWPPVARHGSHNLSKKFANEPSDYKHACVRGSILANLALNTYRAVQATLFSCVYDNVLKSGLKARKTPKEVMQYTVFTELCEDITAEREKENVETASSNPPAPAAEPAPRHDQVSAYMAAHFVALAGEETKSKTIRCAAYHINVGCFVLHVALDYWIPF